MLTNVWVSEKIHSNPSFSHPNIWGWGSGYFRLHFSLQPILSVVDMISNGKDDMAKYSQSENSDLYIHIYICIYIYIDDISMRTCTDGEANLWCRWESREIKGNLLGLIWEHLLLLGMLDLHPQKGIKINYWCMSIWTYHCGDINLTTLPSNMEMHIRSTFWIPILLAIDTWLRLIE